jgi:hypothetical protein
MAEHKSRANWFERLREKRRQRKAKAAASIHASRGSESGLERTRRESGLSKGGFGGDGGGFGGM